MRKACDQRGTYANRLRARRGSKFTEGVGGSAGPPPADDACGTPAGGIATALKGQGEGGSVEPPAGEAQRAEVEAGSSGDSSAVGDDGSSPSHPETGIKVGHAETGTKVATDLWSAQLDKLAESWGLETPSVEAPTAVVKKPCSFVVDASTLQDDYVYQPPVEQVAEEDGGKQGGDETGDEDEAMTPITERALDTEDAWEQVKSKAAKGSRRFSIGDGSRMPLSERQRTAKLKNLVVNTSVPVKRALSNLGSSQPTKKVTPKTASK